MTYEPRVTQNVPDISANNSDSFLYANTYNLAPHSFYLNSCLLCPHNKDFDQRSSIVAKLDENSNALRTAERFFFL